MKEKTVKIGDKEVKLKTSGYTPLLYADLFGHNLFGEMQTIIRTAADTGQIPFDKTLVLYRLAYCMAKHADSKTPSIEEWLDQFEPYDIPEIAGELIDMWAADSKQQSTP